MQTEISKGNPAAVSQSNSQSFLKSNGNLKLFNQIFFTWAFLSVRDPLFKSTVWIYMSELFKNKFPFFRKAWKWSPRPSWVNVRAAEIMQRFSCESKLPQYILNLRRRLLWCAILQNNFNSDIKIVENTKITVKNTLHDCALITHFMAQLGYKGYIRENHSIKNTLKTIYLTTYGMP